MEEVEDQEDQEEPEDESEDIDLANQKKVSFAKE